MKCPRFYLELLSSFKNYLGYFVMFLWPSQKIWTLPTDKSMKVMDSLAVRSVQILNTGSSPLVKSFFFGWMPIFKNRKRNKRWDQPSKLKALRIVFYHRRVVTWAFKRLEFEIFSSILWILRNLLVSYSGVRSR